MALAGSPALFNTENPMNVKDDHYIALQGIATEGMHIRPSDVRKQIQNGHISQSKYLATCCAMLANTAYESVKDANDQSPEFEFFRHVRNASSHSNKFIFNNDEPRLAAKWRNLKLDENQKGKANPLHAARCFGQYLGISDILRLLWDIEQKLIKSNI